MLLSWNRKRTCPAVSHDVSFPSGNSCVYSMEQFHSITQPCIIFEFFAIHVPLDFRTFMRCFGCYYFCNLLKDLRFALILLRTVGTLLMQRGNGTLIAWFHIRTAFRCMAGWTSEDFCSLFVEFKISKDIRSRFPVRLVVISSTFL